MKSWVQIMIFFLLPKNNNFAAEIISPKRLALRWLISVILPSKNKPLISGTPPRRRRRGEKMNNGPRNRSSCLKFPSSSSSSSQKRDRLWLSLPAAHFSTIFFSSLSSFPPFSPSPPPPMSRSQPTLSWKIFRLRVSG